VPGARWCVGAPRTHSDLLGALLLHSRHGGAWRGHCALLCRRVSGVCRAQTPPVLQLRPRTRRARYSSGLILARQSTPVPCPAASAPLSSLSTFFLPGARLHPPRTDDRWDVHFFFPALSQEAKWKPDGN
jgi:hypothetical protein